MAIITPVSECLYCQKNEKFHQLMIKIEDMEVSELFLFKEQTYKGRCIVAFKDHGLDIHDLDEENLNAYMRDVARTGKAINNAFDPAKINYGSFGDFVTHLHMHIVPKYKDGDNYGGMFEMHPQKTFFSEEEYKSIINNIKDCL